MCGSIICGRWKSDSVRQIARDVGGADAVALDALIDRDSMSSISAALLLVQVLFNHVPERLIQYLPGKKCFVSRYGNDNFTES
jgi:hypothetical protein